MQLRLAKLHPDADIPTYATEGSIALDLKAIIGDLDGIVALRPGEAHTFSTGIAAEVPAGYGLFLVGRSGHGIKHRLRLGNCIGLIDQDYRGELLVNLTNDGRKVQRIKHNERIAQAVLMPVVRIETVVVTPEELTSTKRGAGGLGSTGK